MEKRWYDRFIPGRTARREAEQQLARQLRQAAERRATTAPKVVTRPAAKPVSAEERQAIRERSDRLAAERGSRRTTRSDYVDVTNPMSPASPLWVGYQTPSVSDEDSGRHHGSGHGHQVPDHSPAPTHHTPSHTYHAPDTGSHGHGGGGGHDFGGGGGGGGDFGGGGF